MSLSTSNLLELREILLTNLPWSPLDFIRELSVSGDRSLFVAQLTSEMESEFDLRTISTLPSGKHVVVFAQKLAWDTAFFGYGVGKLHGVFLIDAPYYQPKESYTNVLRQVLIEAQKKDVRYFFASVDPRDLALMRSLGELGFSLIETRLYYHMDLRNYQPPERYPVRAATEADIPSLGRAAQVMVNPFDRFHSDPFISEEDANRLMYRWVEASIREGFADITVVPDQANPAAFCTVRYHKDKWPVWNLNLAQPVFSAVSAEYRGWYRKLISEINCHLREIGAEHSYLATQVTNRTVLWVWESLGYRFGKGEHIFRIILPVVND